MSIELEPFDETITEDAYWRLVPGSTLWAGGTARLPGGGEAPVWLFRDTEDDEGNESSFFWAVIGGFFIRSYYFDQEEDLPALMWNDPNDPHDSTLGEKMCKRYEELQRQMQLSHISQRDVSESQRELVLALREKIRTVADNMLRAYSPGYHRRAGGLSTLTIGVPPQYRQIERLESIAGEHDEYVITPGEAVVLDENILIVGGTESSNYGDPQEAVEEFLRKLLAIRAEHVFMACSGVEVDMQYRVGVWSENWNMKIACSVFAYRVDPLEVAVIETRVPLHGLHFEERNITVEQLHNALLERVQDAAPEVIADAAAAAAAEMTREALRRPTHRWTDVGTLERQAANVWLQGEVPGNDQTPVGGATWGRDEHGRATLADVPADTPVIVGGDFIQPGAEETPF